MSQLHTNLLVHVAKHSATLNACARKHFLCSCVWVMMVCGSTLAHPFINA